LTDPDHLKSAAEYLLEIARSSEGRRYRKQPKIDALRQYKEEILEAHRSGLSVHRIAQIFRERGVDISVPHLVRTVRRFVHEEEQAGKGSLAQRLPAGDSSVTKERHPESAGAEGTKAKAAVTYQVAEQPSAKVQEEEFAKQLRLARYLAAASLPSRPVEPAPEAKTPKRGRPVAKAGAKTIAKNAREEELAKERRRAGRVGPATGADSRRKQSTTRGPSRRRGYLTTDQKVVCSNHAGCK
jgi:hypothetical protein